MASQQILSVIAQFLDKVQWIEDGKKDVFFAKHLV